MSEIVEVQLPTGEVVLARVAVDDDGPVDVGFADKIGALELEGLTETVRGVAGTIRQSLRHARPDDVTVEFGIEISGKSGKLVSVLAEAGAKATLKVSLGWKGSNGTAPCAEPDES